MTDSIVFAVLLVALFLFIEWRRAADEKVNEGKLLKFYIDRPTKRLRAAEETVKEVANAWENFKNEHGRPVDGGNVDNGSSEGGDRKK